MFVCLFIYFLFNPPFLMKKKAVIVCRRIKDLWQTCYAIRIKLRIGIKWLRQATHLWFFLLQVLNGCILTDSKIDLAIFVPKIKGVGRQQHIATMNEMKWATTVANCSGSGSSILTHACILVNLLFVVVVTHLKCWIFYFRCWIIQVRQLWLATGYMAGSLFKLTTSSPFCHHHGYHHHHLTICCLWAKLSSSWHAKLIFFLAIFFCAKCILPLVLLIKILHKCYRSTSNNNTKISGFEPPVRPLKIGEIIQKKNFVCTKGCVGCVKLIIFLFLYAKYLELDRLRSYKRTYKSGNNFDEQTI